MMRRALFALVLCAIAALCALRLPADAQSFSGYGPAGEVQVGGGTTAPPSWWPLAKFGTNGLTLGIQGTSAGSLTLTNTSPGSVATTIASSNSALVAYTLTLPTSPGTNGYLLGTNGSGVTSWISPSSTMVTSFSAGTTGFTPSSATTGAIVLAGTLGVANGGTNCTAAAIGCFNNITGFSAAGTTGTTSTNLVFSGSATLANPTVTGAFTATGLVTLGDLATQATNTVLVNATSGTASPTAQSVSGCSAAADALIWTTNTGFGCNTSITAAAVPANGLTGTTLSTSVVTSSLTTVGTIGTGVWQGTGIGLAYGGTNANLTANAGGVVYSTASALAIINNPNSNGECLLSGTSAPTWGSCSGATGVASLGNYSSDTTLNITGTGSGPWTGTVTAELNLANANTWTGVQTHNTGKLVINGGSATAGIATVTSGGVVSSEAVSSAFTAGNAISLSGTNNVTISAIPSNYIAGLDLSNDGTTPNTVLDIASGMATDSTNAAMISLGAFTKSISGAWTSGSGNNGMGNGLTATASTWYHVCLANNGGTADIWFDTSATCANRPSGISDTKYRRIGSIRLNSSTHITSFSQNGNEFLWSAPVGDQANINTGTTPSLYTFTVPTGVVVNVLAHNAFLNSGAAGSTLLVYSPATATQSAGTPSGNSSIQNLSTTIYSYVDTAIRSNTSAQYYAVNGSASNNSWYAVTYGWIDLRGTN